MFRAIDQCVLVLHALTPDALTLHLPRSFVPNNTFSIFTGDVVESAVWAVDQPVQPVSPTLTPSRPDALPRPQLVTSDMEAWHADMQPVSYPVIGNQCVPPRPLERCRTLPDLGSPPRPQRRRAGQRLPALNLAPVVGVRLGV